MTTRRSALGRGLGALIPGAAAPPEPAPQAVAAEAPPALAAGPQELAIDEIVPNPEQPRRVFDPAELERLADSIRRHGVLQPVVVRRAEAGYELVVGERRWRASQLAGRRTIPAVVADIEPRDRLEIALVENVQRHDLNPIELALAFRALAEAGATQEDIGRRVALDRATVANHLRLLDLPRELQGDVESGLLTVGHAKALLQVSNPERRRYLRDRIVGQHLSVRAAEEAARVLTDGSGRARPKRASASPPSATDPNLERLVDALRQRLKTRVRISGTAGQGRIEIDYFGPEELGRLVSEILGDR
jgi:ParB family chromosome partitioning protein